MASDTSHGLNITGSTCNKDKNCFGFGRLVVVIPIASPHSLSPDLSPRRERGLTAGDG